MKRIFLIIQLLTTVIAYSQVAIGKSSVTNNSVSLEFYDSINNAQGIILPWTSTVSGTPSAIYTGMTTPIENGTFIMDLSDYKMKIMKNGSWFDLTQKGKTETVVVTDANSNLVTITGSNNIDTSLQDTAADGTSSKVVIGGSGINDTKNGILVLSDSNKAMILPKVPNAHLNVINPSPGMMVYDPNTHQLAVFNGTVWSFWKP